MILYAISDRRMQPGGDVARWAADCIEAGVDWVQIREKDLEGGALADLARRVRATARGGRVLINERTDIAIASGLDGVHLPADSAGAAPTKRLLSAGSLVGVSCHRPEEVARAEAEGADFVVFGPVFDTPSKRAYGSAQGLSSLAVVCRQATIPVLALGGITRANAVDCIGAGASGVAGISLFAPGPDRAAAIEELKTL